MAGRREPDDVALLRSRCASTTLPLRRRRWHSPAACIGRHRPHHAVLEEPRQLRSVGGVGCDVDRHVAPRASSPAYACSARHSRSKRTWSATAAGPGVRLPALDPVSLLSAAQPPPPARPPPSEQPAARARRRTPTPTCKASGGGRRAERQHLQTLWPAVREPVHERVRLCRDRPSGARLGGG